MKAYIYFPEDRDLVGLYSYNPETKEVSQKCIIVADDIEAALDIAGIDDQALLFDSRGGQANCPWCGHNRPYKWMWEEQDWERCPACHGC